MGENLHIDIIVAPPGEALPCLKCGYDLRANAGDRCSECGWEIDRELLKGGWFPWERRQYRGRFISYVKTVWQVSVGSGKLAEAAERMHPLGDGRSFARWTGAMVMISLVGLFFVMVAHEELWRLAIAPQPDWPRQTPRPAWVEAVAVPWSAGVILPMVGPLMLAIFAFFVARMPKRLFVGKNANAPAAQSARAVACYAAAPMAWLLPVAMLIALVRGTSVDVERFIGVGLMVAAIVIGLAGIVVRIRHAVKRTKANIWIMPAMLLIALLLFLIPFWLGMLQHMSEAVKDAVSLAAAGVVVLLTILRVIQWSTRTKKSSLGRAMIDVLYLLGAWLGQALVFFGILPWCIGYVWIVIDSFR